MYTFVNEKRPRPYSLRENPSVAHSRNALRSARIANVPILPPLAEALAALPRKRRYALSNLASACRAEERLAINGCRP